MGINYTEVRFWSQNVVHVWGGTWAGDHPVTTELLLSPQTYAFALDIALYLIELDSTSFFFKSTLYIVTLKISLFPN